MNPWCVVSLLLWLAQGASAQSVLPAYYLSSSTGSSGNTGLSADSPKQFYAQLQALPGFGQTAGTRIYLKRGDVFRETFRVDLNAGTASAPIQFRPYGTGNAYPVLSGADLFTGGWQLHSGSGNRTIWKRAVGVNRRITQLYLDGKRLIPARWPNEGTWARTTSSHPWGCSFTSVVPFTGGGNFNGANLRARTTNSSYEIRQINQSDPNGRTIGVPNDPASLTNPYAGFPFSNNQNDIYGDPWRSSTPGYGFFVDGKLNLLDTLNEWHYDAGVGTLYLMTGSSQPPNDRQIEGFVRETALEIPWGDARHLLFDSLEIRHTRRYGVYIGNSADNQGYTFRHCYLHDHEGNTLQNNSSAGFLLEKSRIENGYWTAVQVGKGAARDNVFRRNCLLEGYGEDWFGATALEGGLEAQRNVIDSSGYIGMGLANNGVARHNLVTNACLVLNDGAAIAIPWSSRDMLIEHNVINNVVGNVFTNGPRDQLRIAKGMYFGGKGHQRISFRNNTILHTPGGAGIGMLDAYNCTITGNTVYGAAAGIMHYNTLENPAPQTPFSNTITNNIFIADEPTTANFLIRSDWAYTDNIGFIDQNTYWQPYTGVIARLNFKPNGFEDRFYSLDSWKAAYPGRDGNSRHIERKLTGYKVQSLGPELLLNGTFTAGVTGWEGVNAGIAWDSGLTSPPSLLQGNGVLTGQFGATDYTIKAAPITLATPGRWYQLRFKHITRPGTYKTGRLNLERGDSYRYLGLSDPFILGPTAGQEARVFWQQDDGLPYPVTNARLKFQFYPEGAPTANQVWLDSISLREVTTGTPDPVANYVRVFVNSSQSIQTITPAPDSVWTDLAGNAIVSLQLESFTSKVLLKTKRVTVGPLVTLKAGLWSDPTVWSCNCLPIQSDSVDIRHLVTIPAGVEVVAAHVRLAQPSMLVIKANARLRLR